MKERRKLIVQQELDLEQTDRTAWSTKPPAVGLWEVTDAITGTLRARWWFGGVYWLQTDEPHRHPGISGMTHAQFVEGHAWRGLAQKPEQKYSCPPYDLRSVPPGCELDIWVPIAPKRTPTHQASASVLA